MKKMIEIEYVGHEDVEKLRSLGRMLCKKGYQVDIIDTMYPSVGESVSFRLSDSDSNLIYHANITVESNPCKSQLYNLIAYKNLLEKINAVLDEEGDE